MAETAPWKAGAAWTASETEGVGEGGNGEGVETKEEAGELGSAFEPPDPQATAASATAAARQIGGFCLRNAVASMFRSSSQLSVRLGLTVGGRARPSPA
jgi:hypothetical protein